MPGLFRLCIRIKVSLKKPGINTGSESLDPEPRGKGRNINSIKDLKRVKERVRGLVNREIKYISGIFPYHDNNYFNHNLIYFQGVMLWKNLVLQGKIVKEPPALNDNLVNLLTGLELLGMGLSFHGFNTADYMPAQKGSIPEQVEKKYTLSLLFGDIFYSRAVIYFLKFHDYEIFRGILNSLKKVHECRLELHKDIRGTLKDGRNIIEIGKKKRALIMANGLLRESFHAGYEIFKVRESGFKADDVFEVIDLLVTLMTYNGLESFYAALGESPLIYESRVFLRRKIDLINERLGNLIPALDFECLKKPILILKECLEG